MLDCLIIGDSIAYGISNIRTECVSYVQSGINSRNWNTKWLSHIKPAKNVIISLGTNDLKDIDTFEELNKLRSTIKADSVYWVMPPIKIDVQQAVWLVSVRYCDKVIKTENLSNDNIHPTYKGYVELANQTKIQ